MMRLVTHNVMQSDPNRDSKDVWHLVLQKEPWGSPSDEGYEGGLFKMDGMTGEQTIRLLRGLADFVEAGGKITDMGVPPWGR